ncbi:MAG: Eco57I restriction-modification methylase domain-containing protein, partial [Chitinophagaceae bacterium]|nr:Eco57I restriction-modification methylase domain-containing protein [Chitinophagaceae bacterium]
LDRVKVCGPAIGSGAFPMGMLQEIYKAKTNLDLTLDHTEVKKQIIQNCIYGVDIENGAVEIARLRFWLALVVDETTPNPLPNLDYKIMQGNSLLESFEGVDLSNLADMEKEETFLSASKQQLELGADFSLKKQSMLVFDQKSKTQLYELISDYYNYDETTNTKYKSKQFIKDEINGIVEGKLIAKFYLQKPKQEQKVKDIHIAIKGNRIMAADAPGIRLRKEKNLEKLNKELSDKDNELEKLNNIIEQLHELQSRTDKPYFLWHLWFKDVFDKGGFDIVIGNPPYIKVQSLPKEYTKHFKSTFSSATGKYDIYVLFIEYSFSLLKKNGCIAFINPHRFLIAEYGEGLRNFLLEKKAIKRAVYFGVEQIFETATTYTGIFLFKENSQELEFAIPKTKELDKLTYSTKKYDSSFNFNFLLDTTSNPIIDKIVIFEKVKDIFEGVYQGIIPMGDDIQVLEGQIKGEIFVGYSTALKSDITIEASIVKPLLKGENIKRYQSCETKIYIFFPHYTAANGKTKPFEEKFLKQNFPLAYKYIKNFETALVAKKIKYKTNPKYWYSLHRSREQTIFESEKIITPQLQNNSSFTLDKNKFYADAGGYMILPKKNNKADLKSYLAIFNSKLFYYFIKKTSTPYNNDYYYFKTNYIEPFGIPELENESKIQLSKIVRKIFALKNEKLQTTNYENKIDALVFHLYKLTESEMLQVLDTFKDLSIKDRNQIQNEYWNITNNKFQLEA